PPGKMGKAGDKFLPLAPRPLNGPGKEVGSYFNSRAHEAPSLPRQCHCGKLGRENHHDPQHFKRSRSVAHWQKLSPQWCAPGRPTAKFASRPSCLTSRGTERSPSLRTCKDFLQVASSSCPPSA